jgi:hypothetical protein
VVSGGQQGVKPVFLYPAALASRYHVIYAQPSLLQRTGSLLCGMTSSFGRKMSSPPKSLHVTRLHQFPPDPLIRC